MHAQLYCYITQDEMMGAIASCFQGLTFNSRKQGIDKGYIDALAEIQNGASTVAMLHRESNKFPIRKGVRKVIQFHQSYSQKLWKICSVTLIAVAVVFPSMKTNFRISGSLIMLLL